jgi:hypothetical protein
MSIESRIKTVFFARVARSTQDLQVAQVVAAAFCKGNDVVNREFCFLSNLATALTLMLISL